MKVLKYPIIGICCFFVSGIVFDFYVKPDTTVLFVSLFVSIAVFCLCFYFSNRHFLQKNHFGISACLLALLCGSLTHHLHYAPNNNRHYSHYIAKDIYPVKGVISERLKPNPSFEKYLFNISEIHHHKVRGKILLYVPKSISLSKPIIGSELVLRTELIPIRKNSNPFQFDYAAYMAKQNVFDQIYLTKDNFIKTGFVHSLNSYVAAYRDRLLSGLSVHSFKPEVRNIIHALVLGQRQDIEKSTTNAYADAGAVHILAISGLHIAILYGLLLLLTKPLKKFKNGKILHFLLPLLILWFYAMLTGFSASVVRSVTMFSCIGFSLYLNRLSNSYNTLAISIVLLLIFKPNFIFDIGFQLSYAAVFAIVGLQPFYKKARFSKNRIINYFTDITLISLAAQIGVLPLCLYYFHQFPLLFLFTNLIVIPLATVILTLGIVLLTVTFISEYLALFLGKMLSFLIEMLNAYIAWIASFQQLVIKDIPFTFLLMIGLYAVVFSLLFWLQQRSYFRWVIFLLSVMLLQMVYLSTLYICNNTNDLIVFNNRKHTLIVLKDKNGSSVFSNDSLIGDNYPLKMYQKGVFYPNTEIFPLRNVFSYQHQRILLIDDAGIYSVSENPDIIILIHSPKINMERLLTTIQPKLIIADGTNYKSYTERWEASCQKAKIPFHSTSKKGFYSIANAN